jgi:tRNA A-37 threonylcarbamoyl transferase component Bud32
MSSRDPREATLPAVAPPSAPSTIPPPSPPAAPSQPDLRPRVIVEGVIAQGGMGQVRRIYDRRIGRYAAMKVLDPHLARDPSVSRRFAVEARVTGQLQHPNIVPVHDFVLDDGGTPLHFTMPLVEGHTLAAAIERRPPGGRTDGDLWELLQAFLKVCDAVAFAHSRGVVHCDLKPENVMLGPFGQVYVMDWGVAHVRASIPWPSPLAIESADAAVADSIVGGTVQYMAPEQAQGRVKDIDPRTDVYALGGILYAMITGRPPHDGATQAAALEQARKGLVPDPAEAAGGAAVAEALARIAMKALSVDREARYQTVDRVKRDVEAVLRGGLWFGTKRFAAGATILAEGDDADAAYILLAGHCEVFRTVDGARVRVREMGPGEVFGEMAIVSSRPRSATVVAMDEVTVVVISKATLDRELEAGSWLGALVRTLVDRFRELEERSTP